MTRMLRDPSLVPLSHQHQHTLAMCVRLDRDVHSGKVDVRVWQEEITRHYTGEIRAHFGAEEQILFPAANHFPELDSLVEELREEHHRLREIFDRAAQREMTAGELGPFSRLLSGHIRKEERKLFESLQRLMRSEDLRSLGERLGNRLSVSD